jgi:hypothetical protein
MRRFIGAVLSLSVMGGSAALADTLICADGRRIHGEIVLEGGVYKVTGKFGKFEIPERDVVEWKKGEAAAPITPPPTPPVKPAMTPPAAKPKPVDDARKAGSSATAATASGRWRRGSSRRRGRC